MTENLLDLRKRRMADAIYRRMLAAGLNQTSLAKAAGLPGGYVTRYVNAEQMPRPESLRRLAIGLGCTLEELVAEAEGAEAVPDDYLAVKADGDNRYQLHLRKRVSSEQAARILEVLGSSYQVSVTSVAGGAACS
ncbi:helix-turn-helix transcriptional regulator [uncultured Marinobacter sp.]|uniref:helix-turn-helix domain-containing protein n=1 Tax=uncultured Marinobacter sp. TaxID=187379 RepID=UPI002589D316|nr:helix-turn-helix transcriptional regulator [uncultured Marinobacter sp.]